MRNGAVSFQGTEATCTGLPSAFQAACVYSVSCILSLSRCHCMHSSLGRTGLSFRKIAAPFHQIYTRWKISSYALATKGLLSLPGSVFQGVVFMDGGEA